jgi:hypothetical protein
MIQTQTLAQLDDELVLVLSHLDSELPEDQDMANQLLAELLPQLDQKIDSYMGLVNHYGDRVNNIDREIARLEVRRSAQLAKQDYLKSVLQNWLELRSQQLGDKGKKVEGNFYKVSLVANGGKLPLSVNKELPIDGVPNSFKTRTEVYKLDQDSIRDYMQTHGTDTVTTADGIPIATLLPRGKHLRIS